MKTQIEQVNYDNVPDINGRWWSWNETCNRCGNVVQHKSTMSTAKPNTQEIDFCCDCMRYFLDNKIPYEKAKELYGNNK